MPSLEGKIERSMDPRPIGRGPAPAGRRWSRRAHLPIACAVAAFIVSGAFLLSPGVGTELPAAFTGSPVLGDIQNPYNIMGYTNDSMGVPIIGCTVTVTNVDNGGSIEAMVTGDGRYMANLANMNGAGYYYADGDEILVEAVKDDLSGEATGYVDLTDDNSITFIHVTLGTVIPEFPMVILPVGGMLALFAVVHFRHRKAEET